MPVIKCGRCGGNGHNRRTCREGGGSATPAPRSRRPRAPAASRAPTSAALALTRGRPDLEKVRAQMAADLARMDRALLAFGLIESQIPRAHVDVARELLVEAGISKGALEGRQSVAVAQLAVGVSAVLFAAKLANATRRNAILSAAARALGHEQKE